ncbi:putative bifunctional diguanylate cyclase/phosphodiesterase [Cryobacterium roopkundense]|uniref:Diguanylate cyclase (GGDEF)-like protein n=1 Tax=Cryobacterium roopkundense TaxID=1001240 RepID=A0A7W9E5C6_9MICO|nr:bifunctional diguanylate cyclase/phosphodiesterase [Cryobacterium roopkundense]MBB5643118.1 diguanylate cyclase (GGDEF)-like protein [Cryobacterium roopkundense]
MDVEPRETASTTISLLLRHVRLQGGEAAVGEVLARAGVKQDAGALQDVSSWVSYETRIRLFEAATLVLDDPNTMFKVGASAVTGNIQPVLLQLLSMLASPGAIYRQMPRMVPKFTTTSTIDDIAVGRTTATVRYRLHDGHLPSRLDCQYAQGLFSGVPAIFGLSPARVVHSKCQSDGHTACEYVLNWSLRPHWWSWRRRKRFVDDSLSVLRDKVREVQMAAADLVSSLHVDEVLARIVDRADSAVLAPGYVLILPSDDGHAPVVRQRGLSDARAIELADKLLALDDLGAHALVVDIVSTRKLHGYLAAVFAEGHAPMDGDRLLLEAYAGHAAAALDLFTALEESRREGARTAALLSLAHELATSDSVEAVAGIVASALPPIVGGEAASVLLWDSERGELRPIAAAGLGAAERELYLQSTIPVDQTPELLGLLTRREPLVLTSDGASPALCYLLREIGAHTVVAVPLVAGDAFMGVATVSWSVDVAAEALTEAVVRLEGASHQCATAMQNARLLATVRHQSQHDSLTGLPNRVLFALELDAALAACTAHTVTAIVFCDLDGFKRVNDRSGHRAGDELLRQVAARLRREIGVKDTIGRLGGDEFVVVLNDVAGEQTAVDMANRVVESLNRPFRVDGRDVRISASVGVSVFTGRGGQGERLLDAADGAMYAAKRTGRNQVSVAGDLAQEDSHDSLGAELSTALESDEMRLFFQPVVDISDPDGARVVGAEVLVRWAHPRLGVLVPAAFLPLAQETGMMAELDLWVVAAACAAAATWPQTGDVPLTVAVNLDAATLLDDRLLSTVRAAIARNRLRPERLFLEVVESRALVDLPGIVERLVDLRRLGVRISLDDFGTGYSTLTWLSMLPVDQIKIDRSFVMDIPDPAATSLVHGIMALALAMTRVVEVIAEGVETIEQLDVLRKSGCTLVQGYLFGRPKPTLDTCLVKSLAAGASARDDTC